MLWIRLGGCTSLSPFLATAVLPYPNVAWDMFSYLLAVADVSLLVISDNEHHFVIKFLYITLVLFIAINYEYIRSFLWIFLWLHYSMEAMLYESKIYGSMKMICTFL
jgi:hypothetical protein